MAAIQANVLAGVPHIQPGVLGQVADLHRQVLPGVPSTRGRPLRHSRGGCLLMIGDVPLGQAGAIFAMPRVKTLVCRQMPARHRRMLLHVTMLQIRVLCDMPRTWFRSLHALVRHDRHSSSSST